MWTRRLGHDGRNRSIGGKKGKKDEFESGERPETRRRARRSEEADPRGWLSSGGVTPERARTAVGAVDGVAPCSQQSVMGARGGQLAALSSL